MEIGLKLEYLIKNGVSTIGQYDMRNKKTQIGKIWVNNLAIRILTYENQ